MRLVGSDESGFAFRGNRAEVAAHVAGGNAERTEAGDFDVREVLADASLESE